MTSHKSVMLDQTCVLIRAFDRSKMVLSAPTPYIALSFIVFVFFSPLNWFDPFSLFFFFNIPCILMKNAVCSRDIPGNHFCVQI